MVQAIKTPPQPRFTLRTSLGLISQHAQNAFSAALAHYKQESGKLPMLAGPTTDKLDISEEPTRALSAVKKSIDPFAPALLKFSAPELPPLLAIEAAIHHHLDKCRSLPAILYVDSKAFMPALAAQHKRVKFLDFQGVYNYFTGYSLVSITIATERSLSLINPAALEALGGSIPAEVIISGMSI